MNRQRMLQLVVAAAVIVSVGLIAWLLADAPPPATDEPVVEQPARRVELVITGRVVDSAGAPIASATVRCQQVHTKTDKHGMFTCRGLPAGSAVLTIQGVDGRRVARIPLGEQTGEGDYLWEGKGTRGRALTSGVYLARVESVGRVASARLVLLK